MATDARETQSIKSCALAAELRTLVDQATAKAQELYDSTCHPGLTELSGEIQHKAYQARVTARDLRTLADALDCQTHDEYKALARKIASERSSS
jgi:hypothetical protein